MFAQSRATWNDWDVGLFNTNIISGLAFKALKDGIISDEEYSQILLEFDIFTWLTLEQKLRLALAKVVM